MSDIAWAPLIVGLAFAYVWHEKNENEDKRNR
jgi:hypothetical protein